MFLAKIAKIAKKTGKSEVIQLCDFLAVLASLREMDFDNDAQCR